MANLQSGGNNSNDTPEGLRRRPQNPPHALNWLNEKQVLVARRHFHLKLSLETQQVILGLGQTKPNLMGCRQQLAGYSLVALLGGLLEFI